MSQVSSCISLFGDDLSCLVFRFSDGGVLVPSLKMTDMPMPSSFFDPAILHNGSNSPTLHLVVNTTHDKQCIRYTRDCNIMVILDPTSDTSMLTFVLFHEPLSLLLTYRFQAPAVISLFATLDCIPALHARLTHN